MCDVRKTTFLWIAVLGMRLSTEAVVGTSADFDLGIGNWIPVGDGY